ncbi:MAG: hypothetical protein ABIO79_10345 [Ferruginibacter sp.]
MKKSILMLAVIFLISIESKAQQGQFTTVKTVSNPLSQVMLGVNKPFLREADGGDPVKDYAYYNRQARTMRITGLSLLGVGLATGVIALLISTNNDYNGDYEAAERRDKTATTLFVVSATTGIASIPFMIIAHAKKNEAKATLTKQKTFIPGKGNTYITGITVSVPIGN